MRTPRLSSRPVYMEPFSRSGNEVCRSGSHIPVTPFHRRNPQYKAWIVRELGYHRFSDNLLQSRTRHSGNSWYRFLAYRAVDTMKRLKTLTIALMTSGTLGMLWAFLVWNLGNLPQSPDPATGRIYRLSQHGMVVYQTKAEHIVYWSVVAGSIVSAVLGGLLMVIRDWVSDKHVAKS